MFAVLVPDLSLELCATGLDDLRLRALSWMAIDTVKGA